MFKSVIGFIVGSTATALVIYYAVLPSVRESYRAVGYNDGTISARWEISEKVAAMLGKDLQSDESRENLFNVKTRSVVVVERNGVKTLRVSE